MAFKLGDGTVVTCCGDCPMNAAIPNPLWKKLPPMHRCNASIGLGIIDPLGKLILDPNKIASWCPHVV